LILKKLLFIFLPVFILFSCSSTQQRTSAPPGFTVSLDSKQEPLGIIEMQRDLLFPRSGLTKESVEIIYFPEEDAVCFKYRSDFFTYHLFLDFNGRELFRNALEKYTADYEVRDLTDNSRRTNAIYGNSYGYLIWQEFKFTKKFDGNMEVEAGYQFKSRSPYFTFTQKQASYINKLDLKTQNRSQTITMHFTRAQAQELEALLDEELLRSHAVERIIRNGAAEADVW